MKRFNYLFSQTSFLFISSFFTSCSRSNYDNYLLSEQQINDIVKEKCSTLSLVDLKLFCQKLKNCEIENIKISGKDEKIDDFDRFLILSGIKNTVSGFGYELKNEEKEFIQKIKDEKKNLKEEIKELEKKVKELKKENKNENTLIDELNKKINEKELRILEIEKLLSLLKIEKEGENQKKISDKINEKSRVKNEKEEEVIE
jgi:hypothetical protein